MQPASLSAQTFYETIDPLEAAISDLQDALDDVESAQSDAHDDPGKGVKAIREAQKEMRSNAISLLVASLGSVKRSKEVQRTMEALQIVEPKIFQTPARRKQTRRHTL
jgi:hypothetical protein